jgi:aryl-alcohol dehydrogenase-like predicted oxidoreductase
MKLGSIEGLDKPVSRLILGTDRVWIPPHARHLSVRQRGNRWLRVLDAAFEIGYNAFDTAPIYPSEPALGYWLQTRGVREQVVVISKCGCPGLLSGRQSLDMASLRHQLDRTLTRLRTDYVDLYLLHYCLEGIALSDTLSSLLELKETGRVKAVGISNCPPGMVDQAQGHLLSRGARLSAVSPHFSLTPWNRPLWKNAQSIAGEAGRDARDYYARNRIAVLSYSPLSRGFFAPWFRGRRGPWETFKTRKIRDRFSSPDNEARFRRASDLGLSRSLSPGQVGLAYVLNQGSSYFAIVGCGSRRRLEENDTAAGVELAPDTLRWLETGRGPDPW